MDPRLIHTFSCGSLHYRQQIEPEKMRMDSELHFEDNSLREISRTVNLAYNMVVSLVRAVLTISQRKKILLQSVNLFPKKL